MKPASAKAKGRKLANEVKEILLEWCPDLQSGEIRVTPSGAVGEDLTLSPKAREIYPYVIECKNVEKLNIHEALAQAKQHWIKRGKKESEFPITIFTKNRADIFAALSLEDFLKLTR